MLIRASETHEYKLIDVYQQELAPTRGICIIRLNTYVEQLNYSYFRAIDRELENSYVGLKPKQNKITNR